MDYNEQEQYRPLSMWEYFGYEILYLIPIVGFVFLLIHAFVSDKNINRRNFARSYIFVLILAFIALCVGTIIVVLTGIFKAHGR